MGLPMTVNEYKIRTPRQLPECLEDGRHFAKAEQTRHIGEWRRDPSHSYLGRLEVVKAQNCDSSNRFVAFSYVGNVNTGNGFRFT